MANKYLDFNGLSTYDNKIKQYITNKEKKISDKIANLDGLSVEDDDESGYSNLEVYNTVEVDNLITDANTYTDAKVSEISKSVNDYISKITSANAANAANQISYDDSSSNIGSTNVQGALSSIANSVKTIDNIKQNIGINNYYEFSKDMQYQKDDIVIYNGNLYRFTIQHTAGEWNTTHVVEISLKDTINPKNISFNSENEKITSVNVSDAINELATKSEDSTTSKISINAGYEIGAFSKDAFLYGVTNNTSTIQLLNNYQIQYKDTISNSTTGSKFRGTFWKISFDKLEDIKGIYTINSTLGLSYYKYFTISSSIKDVVNNICITFTLKNNEFDAYDLITKALVSTSSNIKTEAQTISKNKYFYVSILNYYSDGLANPINDVISIFHSPNDILVKASNFTDNAVKEIHSLIRNYNYDSTDIICWGGSQTYGETSNLGRNESNVLETLNNKGWNLSTAKDTYPNILYQLFNEKVNISNHSGKDDTNASMFCKQGTNSLFLKNSITLPTDNNLRVKCNLIDAYGNDIIFNFSENEDKPINPCYINDIQCKLSYNSSSDTMYIEKIDNTGKSHVINQDYTPLILNSNNCFRTDRRIQLFWLNEYIQEDELNILTKFINNLYSKKYLILGPVSGDINLANSKEIEKLYYQYFGNNFINLRDYFANYALDDFNISMTTDNDFTSAQLNNGVKSDKTAHEEGSLPSTFWAKYIGDEANSTTNDYRHLSGPAYAIVAYQVHNRINKLDLLA